jgi:hypothetical protein
MKSLYLAVLLLFLSACPTTNNSFYSDGDVAECRGDGECGTPDAPICGLDGQCRACEGDDECMDKNSEYPTCMGGACVAACVEGAAGDAQCLAQDETRPFCVGEACVQCRGDADCEGRICDSGTGLCRNCKEHAECESEACGRDTGICATEADIIYVDKDDENANDLGDCTSAMPCQTIAKAVERIVDGLDPGRIIVVRGGASVVYDGALTLDGITVTLIGSGSTIRPGLDQAGVLVTNGADITIEGFTITGATGNANADGIRCNNGTQPQSTLNVYRATIKGNAATGLETAGCSVTIARSSFSGNILGGMYLRDSSFAIINNFIVANGSNLDSRISGIEINNVGDSDQSRRDFFFNTIARNQANSTTGTAKGIRCQSDNPVTAVGNIIHGNLGELPTISGTCTWSYSNIEGGANGTGNIDEQPNFVNPNGNDFHLQPGSPGVDVEGLSSDILIDFDGDTRPQNELFDMGADEVLAE